uniref:Uncharacterized protein n=1 Tax=Cacopsylla melanoneura TaxID=428564 RepID=A0A8D8VBP6_9HEMI
MFTPPHSQLLPELSSYLSVPSVLKYTPLLVNNAGTDSNPFVYLSDATLQQSLGGDCYTHVLLLLMSEALVLLKVADCELIDAMSLKEMKLVEDNEDDTRLTLSRVSKKKTETEANSFAQSRVLSYVASTTSELFSTPPCPSLPLLHPASTNQSSVSSTNHSVGVSSHSSGDTVLPADPVVQGHVIYMDAKCKRCLVRLVEALSIMRDMSER